MSLIGTATFFALAFLVKIITGEESIVYYHHEIAILIISSAVLYFMHLPVLNYLDIIILGIAVFLAFGRIGCFSVGCCHGKPAKKGVIYGHQHVDAGFTFYYEGVSLFPIQLIESAFVFILIISGTFVLFQHVPPGTILILYTVVYGAFRFFIEYFRGDPERPYLHGLSEAQWTTLILVAFTLVLSSTGYLPFYTWHWIIFLILMIVSSFTIFIKTKDNEFRLLNPRHIKEIATALQYQSGKENNLSRSDDGVIKIYETYEGLSISSGYQKDQNSLMQHYTLSGNKEIRLNSSVVNKMAKIIGQIKKHSPQFEMIEKENGVYHLIFKEEAIIRKSKLETIR